MAEPLAARLWRVVLPRPLRDPGVAGRWAVAWVASGIAAAAVLTAVALRLDRPATGDLPGPVAGAVPRRRGRVAAPALLGAVLLGLVALDLVLGGHGLSQPLLGGSAWDGERFYGLGNGYFAFALASVMLVAGFAPLSAVATAALLAGLGVVDGLPRLGADVGGALTSMLTAAAALVVLAPGRPRARRVVLLAGLAVAAAVAVALGAGLGGPVSHAGRFADRLQQGPADAAGVVVDQLARNLRLLANSPFAWVGPLQVLLAGLIALRPPPPAPRPARLDPPRPRPRRLRLAPAHPAQRHRRHRHLGQRPVPARHPRLGLARPAPPGRPARPSPARPAEARH